MGDLLNKLQRQWRRLIIGLINGGENILQTELLEGTSDHFLIECIRVMVIRYGHGIIVRNFCFLIFIILRFYAMKQSVKQFSTQVLNASRV